MLLVPTGYGFGLNYTFYIMYILYTSVKVKYKILLFIIVLKLTVEDEDEFFSKLLKRASFSSRGRRGRRTIRLTDAHVHRPVQDDLFCLRPVIDVTAEQKLRPDVSSAFHVIAGDTYRQYKLQMT